LSQKLQIRGSGNLVKEVPQGQKVLFYLLSDCFIFSITLNYDNLTAIERSLSEILR